MESQKALLESIHNHWNRYMELMPDVGDAYSPLPQTVYSGGRFDAKTKRIMALVAALTHGCRGCILFQTRQALDLGADAEEILEACAVAVSLGGTMASAETARVVQLLEELGKLPESF